MPLWLLQRLADEVHQRNWLISVISRGKMGRLGSIGWRCRIDCFSEYSSVGQLKKVLRRFVTVEWGNLDMIVGDLQSAGSCCYLLL